VLGFGLFLSVRSGFGFYGCSPVKRFSYACVEHGKIVMHLKVSHEIIRPADRPIVIKWGWLSLSQTRHAIGAPQA
jgi:hypothetical protein